MLYEFWLGASEQRQKSFSQGGKKITLDGNTSWAPSDKNLPLWFSDSSLLEFDVTPQSRNRLVRL